MGRVSVTVETDGDDDCTTEPVHLMPLQCPLKMVEMGDFRCSPAVKTLSFPARGTGSIPGQGTKIPLMSCGVANKFFLINFKKWLKWQILCYVYFYHTRTKQA